MPQLELGYSRARRWLGALLLAAGLAGAAAGQGLSAYYEPPRPIDAKAPANARYQQAYTVNDHIVLLYEKIQASGDEGGTVSIAGRITQSDGKFGDEFTVAAGLPFVGGNAPPLIFGAAADQHGRIFLAYSQSARSIRFLAAAGPGSSQDNAVRVLAFRELGELETGSATVSPRVYVRPDGKGFVLLATQGTDFLLARSADGKAWSPLAGINPELKRSINANPSWCQDGKRELVVFQSLNRERDAVASYQLYSRYSDDGGASWSPLKTVTAFTDPGDGADVVPENYANQRPVLAGEAGARQLFWERTFKGDKTQIWRMDLDAEGAGSRPEAVTDSDAGAYNPVWQRWGGQEYLAWFSAPSGEGSAGYLSVRQAAGWSHRVMSKGYGGFVLYPGFGFAKGKLHYFFYGRAERDSAVTRVVWVEPDQSVDPPTLVGTNFRDGERDKRKELRFRVLPAPDVSGFAAYNLVASRSANAGVPAKPAYTDPDHPPPVEIDGDGTWYILVRVQDKAGNWSAPAALSYVLDTTPPDPVKFAPLPLDEKGYLRSNTFSVSWLPPPQDDVAGYDWSLQYLGDISISEAMAKQISADKLPVMGSQGQDHLERRNVENGIYVLAVWSFDRVGNRSPGRFVYLFANKYVPSTVISDIALRQDALGNRSLDIRGRGFTANGQIVRIVLDRDGLAPYDYELYLAKGDYRLVSDTLIQGVKLANLRSASYLLGVEHSERGFEFSGRRLAFEERGVIKFGDFSLTPQASFRPVAPGGYAVQAGDLVLALAMLLLAVVAFVSVRQLRSVWRESQLIDKLAVALIDGGASPLEAEFRKVATMKRRRLGLRLKFAGFFLALTIAVVLLISLPLSSYTLSRQKSVLADGLSKRLEVLVDSLQSSAGIYLRDPNLYLSELDQLTRQGSIMPEVSYVTITGQSRNEGSADFDALWASSDPLVTGDAKPEADAPAILRRARVEIDGQRLEAWADSYGKSGIRDSLSPQAAGLRAAFDQKVRAGLGTLSADIYANTQKLKSLALNATPAGKADYDVLEQMNAKLKTQRNLRLHELAGGLSSLPGFDPNNYDMSKTDYIFYKPVYFAKDGEAPDQANYYRGLIRIGVSTVPINQEIAVTQRAIVVQLVLFIILALAMGIVLAVVLSAIIVGPIRSLAAEVDKIKGIIALDVGAQVQKFEEHAKHELVLRGNDELSDLNETFSEMVHGLSKAADANVDLYAGKDIQRKFLPLDKRADGKKGATGALRTDYLDVFGYYEGAWGVSGDYFDYKRVTPEIIAFLKCDISGKGVSAALIMVEVATLFQNYFEDWSAKHPGFKLGQPVLARLVTSINDLIADREFVGKFAAMNIVLLNERTGECVFCNAGDEKVFIYRAAQRKVELSYITRQRAAGALGSKDFPVDFKEDRNKLNPGDMLLYFTDGIEEAQSILRNPDFSPAPLTREEAKAGLIPEGIAGQQHEEFGISRINAVVEAVMDRGRYQLSKAKSPAPERPFSFDFGGSRGEAKDAVLYLAAVERVFRLVPQRDLGDKDRIQLDKQVDERLKASFEQYGEYFANPARERELAARKAELDAELEKLKGGRLEREYLPVQAQYDELKGAYEGERRSYESEVKRSGGGFEDPAREAALELQAKRLQELEGRLSGMRYAALLGQLRECERDIKEEENSMYRVYGNLREDPQFDDLTLLAIRKL